MQDLFHSSAGDLTLKIIQTNSPYNKTVRADQDPFLGGWENKTGGQIPLQAPIGQNGLYHIHVEVLSLCVDYDAQTPDQIPKFDSWWFIDNFGNISEFQISKQWIKNTYQWWLSGQISDQEFTNEIQYLMEKNKINTLNSTPHTAIQSPISPETTTAGNMTYPKGVAKGEMSQRTIDGRQYYFFPSGVGGSANVVGYVDPYCKNDHGTYTVKGLIGYTEYVDLKAGTQNYVNSQSVGEGHNTLVLVIGNGNVIVFYCVTVADIHAVP